MLNKKALIGTLMLAGSLSALAQSSINSPYTRYGLGELSDRGFANNAAMEELAMRSEIADISIC